MQLNLNIVIYLYFTTCKIIYQHYHTFLVKMFENTAVNIDSLEYCRQLYSYFPFIGSCTWYGVSNIFSNVWVVTKCGNFHYLGQPTCPHTLVSFCTFRCECRKWLWEPIYKSYICEESCWWMLGYKTDSNGIIILLHFLWQHALLYCISVSQQQNLVSLLGWG